MPKFDIHSGHDVVTTFVTATVTADQDCTGVDSQGFEGIEHIVHVGNSGDTLSASDKIELELEDSDDDVSYADVTDAEFVNTGSDANVSDPDANVKFATIDAPAEDSRAFRIGYRGPKRYSRVVLNLTGTHTNGTPIGVLGLKGRPALSPV